MKKKKIIKIIKKYIKETNMICICPKCDPYHIENISIYRYGGFYSKCKLSKD